MSEQTKRNQIVNTSVLRRTVNCMFFILNKNVNFNVNEFNDHFRLFIIIDLFVNKPIMIKYDAFSTIRHQ